MQSSDIRFLTTAGSGSMHKSAYDLRKGFGRRLRTQQLALLLGATLLAEAAVCGSINAQEKAFEVPAIAPADAKRVASDAPTTAPAVSLAVPPAAERRAVQEEALITLNFRDVGVADLISMISEQGGVEVAINGDVSGTLPYINLTNKTPEAALRTVAQVAGLQLRRTDERAFVIAKELPPEPVRTDPLPEVPIILPYTGGPSASVLPMPDLRGIELAPANVDAQGDERRETRYIQLKNVPPRLMAWWIDPQNQPMPLQYSMSQQNTENYFKKYLGQPAFAPDVVAAMNGGHAAPQEFPNTYAPQNNNNAYAAAGGMGQFVQPYTQGNAQFGFGGGGGGNNQGGGRGNRGGGRNNQGGRGGRGGAGGGGAGGGLFDLTERGVDQIVAIDPQNALLVYATEQGLRDLENIVQFLDRPLRQVEIEAQFVTLNSNELDAFGINFTSANGPFTVSGSPNAAPSTGSLTLGFARGNFQATLNNLVSQRRAKVVTAPRVTAINNLTASLQSTEQIPVATTSVSNNIGGQVGQGQNINFISSTTGLTVTPTINNDDTITVVMMPQVSTSTPTNTNGISVPQIRQDMLQTVANLKDGDTIVLGGLRRKNNANSTGEVPFLSRIPIIGGLFRSRENTIEDSDLVIFLTARIIRRLDDTQPVPGT